jgi:citrate lyase subunit gamma (acyl carrier protein)
MDIVQNAVAGTLESNDIFVSVEPGQGKLEIAVQSIVFEQFGDDILKAAQEVCDELGVKDANLRLEDRGALDCTIKARVETALKRAGR